MMNKINIYLFDKVDSLDGGFINKNLHRLPMLRQQQCIKYRNIINKNACIIAYLLLEKGLKEQYGIVEPIAFIYNEYGKPYLKDYPHIFFNISHCKCGVICAIADFEIGIDIQDIQPFNIDIVRRVCCENELRQLSESDNPARLFCEIWTKKESYAKAKGISVADILKHDLPDTGYFKREYKDYNISLFGNNYFKENDVNIIYCESTI